MVNTPGKPILGRLEKIDVRTYWEREDIGFTPWLVESENIELFSSQSHSRDLVKISNISKIAV
ncbi:MAG: hypothetical protein MUF72_00220 [Elainella sp. Prado103]|jgi:hypothetical protein|nr:hypothetical protein [Elainella sp. Prado103]